MDGGVLGLVDAVGGFLSVELGLLGGELRLELPEVDGQEVLDPGPGGLVQEAFEFGDVFADLKCL